MRFLIAVKDTSEESKNLLRIGVDIAHGFSADISVIYVGQRPRGIIANEVALARRSLVEWNIHHPGISVLQWAYNAIREFGFLGKEVPDFDPSNLVDEKDRIRMVLPDISGEKIRLILREGTLLNELKMEIEHRNYELAIIRQPSTRRHTHQLIQFLNTSILVVKNFNPSWDYNVLLCVDDSPATKRAVIFGARVSKQFEAPVKILTVSKRKGFFGKGYRTASRWAQKYLSLQKIPYSVSYKFGNPTDVFVQESGSDHIIIMGKGTRNEFFKFITGSKAIHTAQKSNCPVLIVTPQF